MKSLLIIPLIYFLIGAAKAQGFEKFWASSAISLDGNIKCNSRKTTFWAISGPCDDFIPQRSYKLGDKVNLDGKIVEIGAIQVTRYINGVKGDGRYGLQPIQPGGMTCSVAASKQNALAINDPKSSTTWIQIHSCKPNL